MYSESEEPEPDYQDEADVIQEPPESERTERSSSQSSEEGLIQPRKLPNPCVESPTRMALHKELLMNYKRFEVMLCFYFLLTVLEKVLQPFILYRILHFHFVRLQITADATLNCLLFLLEHLI